MSLNQTPATSDARHIEALSQAIESDWPVFKKLIDARIAEFGEDWIVRFEREMETYFQGDLAAVRRAADAYCRFSIESMRLQLKFDITLSYDATSYDAAAEDVYHNDEYMLSTYLPALLLSHYLWPHHFRQIGWSRQHFVKRLERLEQVRFCDVGIGTGFYSKELLGALPDARGWGVDVSTASIQHTGKLLDLWNLRDRYTLCQSELSEVRGQDFNAFVCVELLEHLPDPQAFLNELRMAVSGGAIGFITAAIDAPNRDHIYLYRDMDSIAGQLETAGFEVMESVNFAAYEVTGEGQTVPQSGCFVVTAKG